MNTAAPRLAPAERRAMVKRGKLVRSTIKKHPELREEERLRLLVYVVAPELFQVDESTLT